MGFEITIFAVCLVCLLSTLVAKYLTTVRILRYRERVRETEVGVAELRTQLKTVENEHAVILNNEKNLTARKNSLERRIPGLRKELKDLGD